MKGLSSKRNLTEPIGTGVPTWWQEHKERYLNYLAGLIAFVLVLVGLAMM